MVVSQERPAARRRSAGRVVLVVFGVVGGVLWLLVITLLVSLKVQSGHEAHNRSVAAAAAHGRAEGYAAVLASRFRAGSLVKGHLPPWGSESDAMVEVTVLQVDADGAQVVFMGSAQYNRPDFLFGDSTEALPICYQVQLTRTNGQVVSRLDTPADVETCLQPAGPALGG
ncbi:hypothetical protein [Streptacidiphilus sp. PAMC 29251]